MYGKFPVLFFAAVSLLFSLNHFSHALRLVIHNKRNLTGHTLMKVRVEQISDECLADKNAPLLVDVEQGPVGCSGTGSEYLQVTITTPPVLAPGYELFPLVGRYKFHTSTQTWQQAYDTCQQEGGHLAVINSEQEAIVFKDLFSRYPNITTNALLGFSDIVQEGKHITIFGEDLKSAGYVKWSGGEPNNLGGSATHPGQDCGAVTRNALLDDISCKGKYPFFCEQELWENF